MLLIPAEIRTRSGYLVDTNCSTWRTPPGCTNFYWSKFVKLGAFTLTLQAYAAALLGGKCEGYSTTFNSACTALADTDEWRSVASEWTTTGEISFKSMLRVKEALYEKNPNTGRIDFLNLRVWYEWANGLRVPGFTDETLDRLRQMNLGRSVSFAATQRLIPGAPKSRASKNRRAYTDVDFARIQASLLRLEMKLNSGEIIFSTGNGLTSLPKNLQEALKERAIGTRHLVLGWLACMFGERPIALCLLRASSFEFYEVDGIKFGTVQFSGEVKRSYGRHTKLAKRSKLPLNGELIRLVPKLMEENRVWAVTNGIDPELDLPLFPVARPSSLSPIRNTLDDKALRLMRYPPSIDHSLKALFRVLNVRTTDGTLIVPTFYSHRDGNTTRWTRIMPLESVAVIHGKKGISSFKHYVRPGIRHVTTLDSVPEYSELAEQLKSPVPTETLESRARIPSPYPYVVDGKRRVGVEGGCGCIGSVCPMAFDGTVDCYVCPAFTPTLEGPHEWTLQVLMDRKADMIERGLPRSEHSRYDQHIAAVGIVIRSVREYWLAQKRGKPT